MGNRCISLILSIVIAMTLNTLTFAADTLQPSTIEVVGRAKVMVMPNLVTLYFAIDTSAKNAHNAVKENAERTEDLLKSLGKAIGKKDRINTSSYSLSPIYEKGRRDSPTAFRVNNWVVLKTSDLDKAGSFIDLAARSGASRIGNPKFENDKLDEVKKRAMIEAVLKASKDAHDLASAAGLTIRKIIRIIHMPKQPTINYPAITNTAGLQTSIVAGQIPVEAEVKIIYEVD